MRVWILAATCLLAACASRAQHHAAGTLALDHFWIATSTGAAAERAALEQAGFRISPTVNRHDGQGTASQTVEFENGHLELLYPDPSVPVTGDRGRIAQRRFTERANWRETNVSPFGVAVRRNRIALWTAGLVFLAFWLPYDNGLRPEPIIARMNWKKSVTTTPHKPAVVE